MKFPIHNQLFCKILWIWKFTSVKGSTSFCETVYVLLIKLIFDIFLWPNLIVWKGLYEEYCQVQQHNDCHYHHSRPSTDRGCMWKVACQQQTGTNRLLEETPKLRWERYRDQYGIGTGWGGTSNNPGWASPQHIIRSMPATKLALLSGISWRTLRQMTFH